jgi:tetrahydromethanopterin S-methyltransferase subunit B
MKLGKDSALEKLRTSKDDLISALKKESATWDSFDDKEAIEILDIYEKNKYVFSNIESFGLFAGFNP